MEKKALQHWLTNFGLQFIAMLIISKFVKEDGTGNFIICAIGFIICYFNPSKNDRTAPKRVLVAAAEGLALAVITLVIGIFAVYLLHKAPLK